MPAIHLPNLLLGIDSEWRLEAELRGLTGVRVAQRLGLPTQCELYFSDPPGPLDWLEGVVAGSRLEIALGSARQSLFLGEVTALEYIYTPQQTCEIYLRGYDELHRLHTSQMAGTREAVSLAGLANILLRQSGITAAIQTRTRDDTLVWPLISQPTGTNFDLLVETAAQEGCYPFLHQDTLHLLDLHGLDLPAVELELGDNLLEARLEINAGRFVPRVKAVGWDPHASEVVEFQAAPSSQPDLPQSDPHLSRLPAGERYLVNEYLPGTAHAESLAQAEMDHRNAGARTFWGRANGSVDLFPGRKVSLSQVSPRLEGEYVLTEATHVIDSNGYETTLSSTPPPLPERPSADIATLGLVVDVRDPDGRGRARVKLPAFADLVTGWLPVVAPGAGAKKGLLCLADPGDRVLVLLLRGNPAAGVILGGLLGGEPLKDSGVLLGETRSFRWGTGHGQAIELGEVGKVVRLETGGGAYIELSGSQITIGGSSVDFKRVFGL